MQGTVFDAHTRPQLWTIEAIGVMRRPRQYLIRHKLGLNPSLNFDSLVSWELTCSILGFTP